MTKTAIYSTQPQKFTLRVKDTNVAPGEAAFSASTCDVLLNGEPVEGLSSFSFNVAGEKALANVILTFTGVSLDVEHAS